jgi:hypothetical protein
VDRREDGAIGKSTYPLYMLYQFVGVKIADVGKLSGLSLMLPNYHIVNFLDNHFDSLYFYSYFSYLG